MATKKFGKGDIVQVNWGDAWSDNKWNSGTSTERDGDCKPFDVTCVAAVIHANKKGILLTIGFASDGKSVGELFIPRGMIFDIKKLVPNSKIKTRWMKSAKKQKS